MLVNLAFSFQEKRTDRKLEKEGRKEKVGEATKRKRKKDERRLLRGCIG